MGLGYRQSDEDVAFEESLKTQKLYDLGWNAATKFHRETFLSFFNEYADNPFGRPRMIQMTRQDIEDLFKESPDGYGG